MFEIRKTMEISASHCLALPYESKCARKHGHNWLTTIYCRTFDPLGPDGMVIDFTEIKKRVSDKLDHRDLNEIIPQPTAENIAQFIAAQIPEAYRVEVQESMGNVAIYEK